MMPMPAVFPVTPAPEKLPSRAYGLTRVLRDTMLVLQELTLLDGQPPRVRDIGAELGIPNPGRVQRLLRRLKERGYIDWIPDKRRSIVIRVPLPIPAELLQKRPRIEILRMPESV